MKARLLFVLGKGGVGRTSLAAALALRAGQEGRRSLVVELNGLWDIGRRFGHPRSYTPVPIGENVHWRSLSTADCLADFGRTKLQLGAVGSRLMRSRPLRSFVQAIPGLPDLLQLGKIENLLNEPAPGDPIYDLVVVDAPATGHGLSLLAAPASMSDLTESGPFHELAAIIARALEDPSTQLVAVTLAEELPFTELMELLDTLERSPFTIAAIIANKIVPAPLPSRELWPLVRAAQPSTPDHERLIRLVESIDAVARSQEEVLQRLYARAESASIPLHVLPWLTEPTPTSLATHLEAP